MKDEKSLSPLFPVRGVQWLQMTGAYRVVQMDAQVIRSVSYLKGNAFSIQTNTVTVFSVRHHK